MAEAFGLAAMVVYNWWVVVPFRPGLLRSPDSLFSDLEAAGQPDAVLFQHLDLLAGALLMAALLLGAPTLWRRARGEWTAMVAFAAAGATGGIFSYACVEGTNAVCRSLQWHFQLPLHHYLHMASGIVEFGALTLTLILAVRRHRGLVSGAARRYRALAWVLAVSYPLLGVAYLTDRMGAFVEPIFFVTFTTMVLSYLFEGARPAEAEASAAWAGTGSVSRPEPGGAELGTSGRRVILRPHRIRAVHRRDRRCPDPGAAAVADMAASARRPDLKVPAGVRRTLSPLPRRPTGPGSRHRERRGPPRPW